ncbi:cyclic pyranopterin monophosphate synthase subunit MoaA [Desulfomicrobium apsheronum]|uniref:GTP 3',8-cyclase n=1 Tax=Desulfomicrobium apsheronum TaxID=52560 RepID=A0A1I3ZB52_9BACT|nr:GTP 3',8-cyclase MoaA [Desulfomicrobium apsheronum]SFK41232.1 cyclic pyranopterin monophosphate synthase subunit MoaA [Desulfomicrobium apsheronum]
MLIDSHGRKVSYLRLSITDRCNLRCLYCRPQDEWTFIPHEQILSFEEMAELVDVARQAGVEKVRLTGGEPFARKDFIPFVGRLHVKYPDLDLRITTNGTLLADRVDELREAGISCLNISLDTLQRKKFEEITKIDAYDQVRAGIDACLKGGLRVKVNVVALKGINDDELPGFVDFARDNGVDVRFIEFMPIGYQSRWSRDNYWPAEEIISKVEKLVPLEEVLVASRNSGPARMYGISGGSGRIGVISAVSNHFCESCNRFRVTSDGKLRTCLFSDREYDVRSILRDPGHTMQDMLDLFARANAEKPMGYRLLQEREHNQVCDRTMTAIGG